MVESLRTFGKATGLRATRAGRVLARVILTVGLLAACTGEAPQPEPSASPAQTGDTAAQQAGDLRLTVEQHLGASAYLLLEGLRAPARDQEVVADAADDHAAALADTLSSAYDDGAGSRFIRLWGRYTAAAEDYRDQADAQEDVGSARKALSGAADDLAEFMAETTGGEMEVAGTQALVRAPTRDIMRSLDAGARRDHETAYLHQREAFAEMIATGRAMAAGMSEHLPEQYPGLRSSGPLELRSALRQLLGEHALVATIVLRRGSKGAKDFAAAAAALNGNTGDVVNAVESIYGGAGDDLGGAWRGRISLLAEYTVAAVEQPKQRDAHRRALRKADARVAELFAEMTEDNIDGDAATSGVRELTAGLLRATDAYVDGDVADAQAAADDAYDAGLELADLLAEGIVAHRPEEFPTS